MLDKVTPVLITFNEAPNIARTLAPLAWARDIVVVDSGSTDGTLDILRADPRVRVFERPFVSHADQWTFAIEQTGITTEWVLALDADFIVPTAFVEEMARLAPGEPAGGYEASFVYCVNGRPIRGGVYPPVTVLFRRPRARYEQDGHAQRVRVQGTVTSMATRLFHDDRKPLSAWLQSQARYMRLEAEKLTSAPAGTLGWTDRLRRWLVVMPPAVFVYSLVVRGGLLDGRAGLFYALQRAVAEGLLSLFLMEQWWARARAR